MGKSLPEGEPPTQGPQGEAEASLLRAPTHSGRQEGTVRGGETLVCSVL